MMMENKDYPAYPLVHGNTVEAIGLTKRELIAAMAMQGFCSNSALAKEFMDSNVSNDEQTRLIVEGAAKFADALLEALK